MKTKFELKFSTSNCEQTVFFSFANSLEKIILGDVRSIDLREFCHAGVFVVVKKAWSKK